MYAGSAAARLVLELRHLIAMYVTRRPSKPKNSSLFASFPQDHFWPPHAEAYALLARLSALVWNRTAADQLAAANTVNRCGGWQVSRVVVGTVGCQRPPTIRYCSLCGCASHAGMRHTSSWPP